MKGNNTLTLNQASMREAVQLWLDAEMVNSPLVTQVSKSGNDMGADRFEITLNDREETNDEG